MYRTPGETNILTFLAIPAFFIAFFSGGVAFNAWRSGEAGLACKSGAVFLFCCLIVIAAPKRPVTNGGDDCYIDWDGRSNSTVCD